MVLYLSDCFGIFYMSDGNKDVELSKEVMLDKAQLEVSNQQLYEQVMYFVFC